jgi:hypothetical protein
MFPNAIGIQLHDAKHVFGSFLSRETAYQLMIGMIKRPQLPALEGSKEIINDKLEEDEVDGNGIELEATESSKEDSSSLSSEGPLQFKIADNVQEEVVHEELRAQPQTPPPLQPNVQPIFQHIDYQSQTQLRKSTESSQHLLILFIGIALTLTLAFFTAFLLMRINTLENRHLTTRDYSKMSIEEAEQILNKNLITVRNVRQKLEELSSHLETKFKEQSRDEL